MTIAVHIRASAQEDLSTNFNFICFSELAASQPDSHFIFIFDSRPHPELYLEPNCTPVVLSPSLKNSLLRHYWFNYKLPPVIRRYNADVFITAGLTCSLALDIPQCLVVQPADIAATEKSLYLKRFLPAFLKKARAIITADPRSFESLANKHGQAEKLTLLYPGVKDEIDPASYETKELVKNEFTEGHEYFLHNPSAYNFEKVKTVLKSFSIFKKWQKSSMKLVLLIPPAFESNLAKELVLYKYRNDIVISTKLSDSPRLIASAYGVLIESADIFQAALPAMKSGVPVIINEGQNLITHLPGALHTAWVEKDISEKMMRIYKDEHIRSQFISEGLETATKYSWKNASQRLWQLIQNLQN